MARPFKQGLEYFALDVNMSDEVELIEAVHGLVGFAVLIKLFQKIYSEGYFIEWQEKDQILFSNRVSDDRNRVTSIVSDCIKWGIFNSDMYRQYGILTSRRIQEQYFTATYKRVKVTAIREYLIIDVDDRDHVSIIGVSDIRNGATTKVSDDSNGATSRVSVVQSTQSKVKQSKEKVKDKDLVESDATKTSKVTQSDQFDQFWAIYPRKVGKQAVFKIWTKLNPDKDLFGKILQAVEKHKQSEQWTKDNGQFIPNPSTWLNQGRWDDELPQGNGKAYNQRQQAQSDRNRIREDHEYDDPTDISNSPIFQAWYEKERKEAKV
ncbi:MAG: DUF4373 domain-containing protein [Bacteroidales bacterium]|jgi:hypothetical protein|nr:DUF4373 domain-containing protein [Bacteroidales bacterium]